ncbi:MAG: phosphate ABC transporter permease family protein, partial [Novosphingobium sp.]|nr:phosphate ABC transporter permease family protein [Novosphingobium sp.]
MNALIVLLAVLGLGAVGWFTARARARLLYDTGTPVKATPSYHAIHAGLWIILPALALWFVWSAISPNLVISSVLQHPAAQQLPVSEFERQAIIGEAWNLVANPDAGVFNPLARELAGPLAEAQSRYAMIGIVLTLIVMFAGGAYGFTRIQSDFPARTRVERLDTSPVGRDADRTRYIVAGSFGVPAIHDAASPILD